MPRTFVILANASLARLFSRDAATGALVPVATLQHPESRLPGHDLASDRPGHEATDRSSGGNRYEPRSDVRRNEHARFAHELAQALQARLAAGEFDALWMLASDPFLGELNAAVDAAVAARVEYTHAVDLTSFGLAEIEERLRTLRAEHERGHRPVG
ncbi:MAG: host attachment protein [Caldimonas sp.]